MCIRDRGAEDIFAAQMAEVTGVFFRPDELRQFLRQRLPFLLLAQAEAQYQGVGGLTFRKALLIMQDKPLPEGTLDVRGQAAVFCRLLGEAQKGGYFGKDICKCLVKRRVGQRQRILICLLYTSIRRHSFADEGAYTARSLFSKPDTQHLF